ncbi:MAG: hypothetical protein HZB84_05685 [Deltaproteobacteria bacterium]|nr:hypothetical protein [Deltaproteobacteria bacterium]
MTQTQRDDKIDIEAIMGRIRENVRRKKDLGMYADADIEEVSGLKIDAPETIGHDRFLDLINILREDYDFTKTPEITSHRPYIGGLIVVVKKLALYLLTTFARSMWSKQVSFNFHMLELAESMTDEIRRLEKENAGLRTRLVENRDKSEPG